ncbi:MAG: membrane protein insertase YidC [Campylobacterota bacterium]
MDKLDTQKRFLIATVLSLLVFVAYDYFYISKQQPQQAQQDATQTSQAQETEKNAPAQAQQAPQVDEEVAQTAQTQNNNAPQTATSLDRTLVTVHSTNFNLELDRLARINQVTLLESRFTDDDDAQLKLFGNQNIKPLEIRFADPQINAQSFKVPFVADKTQLDVSNGAQTVTLTQTLESVTVTKKITFYPDGHYTLAISTDKNEKFFVTPGDKPVVAVDGFAVHGSLVRKTDEVLEIIESGDANGDERFSNVNIASAFSKYYATMFFDFDNPRNVSVIADNENPVFFINADTDFTIDGYVGPKDYVKLQNIHPELTDAIEYGFFTFISAPLFKVLLYIYDYVGNWGWAIVLVTLLIRIILFPLTHKGMTSMQRLKELSPRIKQLQEKYKGDPQKMNTHMMDFYKKHKVNPMGGCLPLILQIPVFFAIYRVLINAPELKGSEWILWINDLSAMDPYFVLPILMGASMWYQQKLSPNNFTDPMQQKIFQWLPVVFTFFFITFPAGLVLYWLANNIFSIAQQWVINKQFEAKAKRQKDAES